MEGGKKMSKSFLAVLLCVRTGAVQANEVAWSVETHDVETKWLMGDVP